MQATLSFNLPEEETELRQSLNASAWEAMVFELLRHELRNFLKYGHNFKTPDEALEYIRDWIVDDMEDRELWFSP